GSTSAAPSATAPTSAARSATGRPTAFYNHWRTLSPEPFDPLSGDVQRQPKALLERSHVMCPSGVARNLIWSGVLFVAAGGVSAQTARTGVRIVTPSDIQWVPVPGYPPGY